MNTPIIDLAIIGAEKSGTTSLKNYLGEHPNVVTHFHKEFSYFSDYAEYKGSYKKVFSKYFGTYHNVDFNQKIIIKNVTICLREYALERLKQHNPNCKIIYVLREPSARAYSSYIMALRDGWIKEPFDYCAQAIANKEKGEYDIFYRFVIELGLYSNFLDVIYKYFSEDQVNIVLYDSLIDEPLELCKRIFKSIGLDDSFTPNISKNYNQGGTVRSKKLATIIKFLKSNNNPLKKLAKSVLGEKRFTKVAYKTQNLNKSKKGYEPMDTETNELLRNFYRPHVHKCSKRIGIDLVDKWKY